MNKLLKMSFDRMGYTYDYLKDINTDKYSGQYLFKDEDKLILGLREAKTNNLKIVIFPDFDIDGLSSGICLYSGLTLLGFNVELYMPDVNNGYGFVCEDIDKALSQWPDADIILTCDVGITCKDAISYAKSKGLKVYVTDHHIEPVNDRVDADIIVDPIRYDETCDFIGVCGAYVAYHVIRTYADLTGNEAIISLISHLSLFVSLGSMGDLMPVLYDTRNIVKAGLKEFNRLLDCETLDDYFGCSVNMLPEVFVNPFANIQGLHFWLLRNNVIAPGDVTETMYGFIYCPMFNSVKRMGESLENLYGLFYDTMDSKDELFLQRAKWLHDLNVQRKELVAMHFAKFFEEEADQPYAPYVFFTDARPGIMGLLAMKAMGVSGRPTMVVSEFDDCFSGSGRLPKWFTASLLRTAIIKDYITVAGHAAAFGITIEKEHIMDFCEWLYDTTKFEMVRAESEFVETRLALGINHPDMYPECDYSICTNNDYDVCFGCADEVGKYGPYGTDYPEPEFRLFFTKKDVVEYRTMGSDNSHFRAKLDHDITLVYFSGAECIKDFERADDNHVFCFAGNFNLNEFRGDVTLQFKVNSQIC